jgi:hypothetical protein
MRRYLVCALIIAAVTAAAPSAAAQTSTLEAHRANAVALFAGRFDSLTAMRADLSGDVQKYERACRGKSTSGLGTGVILFRSELVWFAQALYIDNETTPACRMLVTGIKTRSQHVARELVSIDEDARRRGIYPGVMCDLKRGYGFE